MNIYAVIRLEDTKYIGTDWKRVCEVAREYKNLLVNIEIWRDGKIAGYGYWEGDRLRKYMY